MERTHGGAWKSTGRSLRGGGGGSSGVVRELGF
jgi:hypothetical protein